MIKKLTGRKVYMLVWWGDLLREVFGFRREGLLSAEFAVIGWRRKN